MTNTKKPEVTFISTSSFIRPVIVMQPQMRQNVDGVTQRPIRLTFKNFQYTTSDEAEIDFIRNHPAFGTEYKELQNGESAPVVVNPLDAGITKMGDYGDPKPDAVEQLRAEMKKNMQQMTQDILATVTDAVTEIVKDAMSANVTYREENDTPQGT